MTGCINKKQAALLTNAIHRWLTTNDAMFKSLGFSYRNGRTTVQFKTTRKRAMLTIVQYPTDRTERERTKAQEKS